MLVLWLSAPMLSNSFLVFPEPFAVVATALALLFAFGGTARALHVRVIVLAAVLGMLPWFHRKYAVYLAAVLCAALWPERRNIAALGRSAQLVALSAYLLPQILLAAWTWQHFGNLGGPLTMMELPPFSWQAFKSGSAGILVDRENGLFAWSPACIVVPAAWAIAGRRYVPGSCQPGRCS